MSLVIGTLVIAAVVIHFAHRPSQHSTSAQASRSTEVGGPTGPSRLNGSVGLPDGRATKPVADEEGAALAAITYATAPQEWLYLSNAEVREAVADIATTQSAEGLADSVVADVSMARDQLLSSSGAVWWLVRPLAWRLDSFTGTQARVSVWLVTVLSAESVAVPQCEFLTVVVDLVWSGSAWDVDSVHDIPGPTPMTGPKDEPWDAQRFADALDGFTRVGEGAQR